MGKTDGSRGRQRRPPRTFRRIEGGKLTVHSCDPVQNLDGGAMCLVDMSARVVFAKIPTL